MLARDRTVEGMENVGREGMRVRAGMVIGDWVEREGWDETPWEDAWFVGVVVLLVVVVLVVGV